MRPDLWVIWSAIVILVGAMSGSVGSRYLPSQERMDDEWDDGYKAGRADEAAEWRLDLAATADDLYPATWGDTAENLAALAMPYFEPLARGAGDVSSPVTTASCPGDSEDTLKGDSPVPGAGFMTSPIYDQLAAEQAARAQLAPPPILPGDGATSDPGPVRAVAPTTLMDASGSGSDPWERLAAELSLDDDPEINEWSARADAARCTEIVRELRQLAEALEA